MGANNTSGSYETLSFDMDIKDPSYNDYLKEVVDRKQKLNDLTLLCIIKNAEINKYDEVSIDGEYMSVDQAKKRFVKDASLYKKLNDIFPFTSKDKFQLPTSSCRGYINDYLKGPRIKSIDEDCSFEDDKDKKEFIKFVKKANKELKKCSDSEVIEYGLKHGFIVKYNDYHVERSKGVHEYKEKFFNFFQTNFGLQGMSEWLQIDIWFQFTKGVIENDNATRTAFKEMIKKCGGSELRWFPNFEQEIITIGEEKNQLKGIGKGFFINLKQILSDETKKIYNSDECKCSYIIKFLKNKCHMTNEQMDSYMEVIEKYRNDLTKFCSENSIIKSFNANNKSFDQEADEKNNANFKEFKKFIMGNYRRCSNFKTENKEGKVVSFSSKDMCKLVLNSFQEKTFKKKDGMNEKIVIGNYGPIKSRVRFSTCSVERENKFIEGKEYKVAKLTKKFKNASIMPNKHLVKLNNEDYQIKAYELFVTTQKNKKFLKLQFKMCCKKLLDNQKETV
jgi:hypothetical protein